MPGVNDFVIRFANVNGTGSASANQLVAKSLFRMGIPIGPKNIFPSNIQGLPTWFEIRVSAEGFTGRRGGVDIMVAMNAQTFERDLKGLDPGGLLIYEADRFQRPESSRSDISYFAIPLTRIVTEHFSGNRAAALLKNIVYVGALVELLGIDAEVVTALLQEQFGGRKALIEANLMAFHLGLEYGKAHFNAECPFKARRLTGDVGMLMQGNEAVALGALFAGASVAAWYPITPSTSVIDAFKSHCDKTRVDRDGRNKYAIIQAEDEIAAVGMVLGASWNGARSFTATSGPGISLMAEFLGYAYYAEIPAVIVNVQRTGPSTGMPTRTQHGDLLFCAYLSHGDTKHIMLFPCDVEECFQMSAQAFDFADIFQTPVFLMSDLELGMNDWMTGKLSWDQARSWDRGKVLGAKDLEDRSSAFYRYEDVDGDGICFRTYPGASGAKGAYFTRGSGHDRYGRYTEDGDLYMDNMDRIARKFASAAERLPPPEVSGHDFSWGIIYVGTTHEPAREAFHMLRAEGSQFDTMRIRSFPFHRDVAAFVEGHDNLIVIDQNRDGQLASLLSLELGVGRERFRSLRLYDGMPATARHLHQLIKEAIAS